jgi:hypothetical protein
MVDRLNGRLSALFERIRRKLHLRSRATADEHDNQTIPLMSQTASRGHPPAGVAIGRRSVRACGVFNERNIADALTNKTS